MSQSSRSQSKHATPRSSTQNLPNRYFRISANTLNPCTSPPLDSTSYSLKNQLIMTHSSMDRKSVKTANRTSQKHKIDLSFYQNKWRREFDEQEENNREFKSKVLKQLHNRKIFIEKEKISSDRVLTKRLLDTYWPKNQKEID